MRSVPSGISYCLECSVETFDLTSDVVTFYHGFNRDIDIATMVDSREHVNGDIAESLRSLSRVFLRPYNEWFWTKGDALEKTWCLASGLTDYGRKAAEHIDSLHATFVSDMLRNGFNPKLRTNQQNWLNSRREVNHAVKITAQLAKRANALVERDIGDALTRPEEFFLRIPSEPQPLLYISDDNGDVIWSETPPVDNTKKAKAVLKKSAAFLSRLVGPEDVSLFVGGEKIEVRGNRFTFSLQKGNLLSESHGALQIAVLDNQTNRRMFNLCWYVDETPALDQMSALVLAVKTGNEDEIIRVGNKLSVDHSAFEGQDHLSDIRPKQTMTPTDGGFGFGFGSEDRMFRLFAGTTEYCRSNPDLYRDFCLRAGARYQSNHVNGVAAPYLVPHHPETIRELNARMERRLLPPPVLRLDAPYCAPALIGV